MMEMRLPQLPSLLLVTLLIVSCRVHAFEPDDLEQLKRTGDCLGCDLRAVQLEGAELRKANLKGADLGSLTVQQQQEGASTVEKTMLDNATLRSANLSGARLHWASLKNAKAEFVNLEDADLTGAHLNGANLTKANLRRATLNGANLTGTILTEADLTGATMRDVIGLPSLLWTTNTAPQGLRAIREEFKRTGMRQQEKELTFAIKRNERANMEAVESAFNYVFFELPSRYGMSPGRPLWILFGLMLVFWIPYISAVRFGNTARWGIWRVWSSDRIHKSPEQNEPKRVSVSSAKAPLWGLYFSVLSAFNIGWRELDVGNWIARISPHEYTLRATGWVKVVAGVQSLVSVYLIALSVLTYFGRPFE